MTVTAAETRNELLIGAAQRMLADVRVDPFLPPAVERVHQHVSAFIDDVVLESVRVMKHSGAVTVSPRNVDDAVRNMTSRRRSLILSFARVACGFVLGIVATMFTQLQQGHHYGPSMLITMTVVAVFTSVAVALLESR